MPAVRQAAVRQEDLVRAERVCAQILRLTKDMPGIVGVKPFTWQGYCHGVEITDLYADEPGQGFGTEVIVTILRLTDKAELNVIVCPDGQRSKAFYEKRGFEVCHRYLSLIHFYPLPEGYDL